MQETQWRRIIEILKKIGDITFQKDVWKEHKYFDDIFSYGESINTLGDYFFFDAIKNRELPLAPKIYSFIDTYIKDLTSYEDSELMFDDPKWLELVERTNSVIQMLKTVI